MSGIQRESMEHALENDRCGACLSIEHFRENCPLREEFADWFAWAYGGPEYAESGLSREHWREITDEFLRQPFMRRYTADAEARGHARGVAEAAALREALTLIASPGCHHSTSEQNRCLNNPERTRGAEYTGDAWCDTCVAEGALRRALDGDA